MRASALVFCLALGACDITPIQPGEPDTSNTIEARPLDPGTRPVRIGESGATFEACATRGIVINLADGETQPLRAAPFGNASEVAALAPGQRVFVCTRSINQRWLGIVAVPPGGEPQACGVSRRVERIQPYDGPCPSGWVASAFIRLRAQ